MGLVQLGLQIFWYDISFGEGAISSGEDVTCVFQVTLSSSSHEVVITQCSDEDVWMQRGTTLDMLNKDVVELWVLKALDHNNVFAINAVGFSYLMYG